MKDDSLHTAFEKLQDLNGGQSHRANLNARFDSIRDHPPKTHAYPRANFQSAHPRRFSNVGAPRARPMANVQPAHSRRSSNVRSPRAQPMANVVESHVRPIPPDPTRGGRDQITKHHPRASPSSGRGGGIIGTRGRMSGFDTRAHVSGSDTRAHVSAFETRGHRASRSREYRTPAKAQPDFSRNITTPEAFLADLRRRSNPPASPTALNPPQRPQPVSRQEPAVPASASSNPAAASTSEVARRSVSPRAPRPMIKTVAQKPLGDTLSGIGRPSSSPQHAGAASHQPRMAISQPTSADPVPANLLLDFNEPEPPRDQQREAISSYSHLQGLDFGGPPTLNWSLDLPPARQERTSADRSAAMKAQVHEHNGSHDRGNLPPLTSAPSYDLFDDPRPYVRSTPAIGQNPFTDPLPLASTENIPFRADRSSEISQTIDYDSFRDYRSPLDPPSSGESKPSKSGATPGLEKLRVSESPTRKPAPNRKPVSELARSIHAEAWLMHHKIGEAKVIGVKASLGPDHLPAHTSEYEYPIPQPPRPKVIGPGPGPSVTRFQRQGTEIQQRVASNFHSGGTSSQRAPVRVLGPASGPLSVRSQRQESLNQAPRNPQDQMVKEPASSNQNPGSSGSQSSAMGFHGVSGSKPKVLGIQPFDPSKKKGKM